MIGRQICTARPGRGFVGLLLLVAAIFALSAAPANAENCSDYGGVLDGDAGTIPPSQLQIDMNCTIRNYPASNPLNTNFSFYTQPGQNDQRWLVVFDNVVHTGQMSCNSVLEHKIWFTNGSSTAIQEGCQNLLIPVEKIDKQNPAGQTSAAIGVPFTYTLTMPVLFDAGTGTVINYAGSLNDLHGVTMTDDLNATGADLTYLSHVAYWESTGAPVPHTFSNVGGFLTFDNFPIIPAGEQIIIEVTVVLDDTPANAPGTQFVNTAKWEFGRLIDGVFYQPLPGEWGISPPMTIGAPVLEVTKTGPATLGLTLNLGQWGQFAIDVQNTGLTPAWDVTILDRLPDGPNGGMCDVTPQILSAQVFEADGVTPVAGKGPLVEGTDFTVSYGGRPRCELTFVMLTDSAVIGPGERLIIVYETQLDANSQDGVTLTNVAGATEWFNDASGNPDRQSVSRPLTNGTIGVADHQDAHTVTVALSGYFFEKTVENLTTGTNPATTAAPGDTLRYSLRLQATDLPINGFRIYDDLGEMNALPVFVPGSLSLVPGTVPPGADPGNTNPNGGTNGAGILDIRDIDVPAFSDIVIEFDITLASALLDGAVVTNQAELLSGAAQLALSDDPNVNGQADPNVAGDEDPTQVVITVPPPTPLEKANTQATATIGEPFTYQITVPSAPHTASLFDVRILDDLSASAADLEFVDVTKVSAGGAWTPVNTGTATNLVIEDPINGIDIPAGEQAVIEITVRLLDTATNSAGLTFTNTAAYTFNQLDSDDVTVLPGGPGTTGPMTIVEPELTLEKTGPVQMQLGIPDTFTLNIQNVGESTAFGVAIDDVLPETPQGGMCSSAPIQITAQLFEADGVTPVGPALAAGTDFDVVYSGSPTCTLTISMLTATAAIGPTERLIITYDTSLDAGTQPGAVLINVAGATAWSSADPAVAGNQPRTYTRALTDGTVGTLDHEDAHTVNPAALRFEKTVANVTRGTNPGTIASPGETLRYRIEIENLGDSPIPDFSLVDELDALNVPAAFAPGTLTLITAPVGADVSATSASGGASGTGLVEIANLSLGPLGDTIVVEFEVDLAPVLANGSYVLNQSRALIGGLVLGESDDPNVNGAADPYVVGDEDPTRIQIESAPYFEIEKISSYVTGDPAVLLAGETLRYTITVKNIGNENAVDAVLRDEVPANTAYVSGSTTLNGVVVPDDPSSAVSPLSDGILINAPEDATPGAMRADPSATASNIATIVFDVVVDPNVIDGTVISNQAFVSAITSGISNRPSDDPRTAVVDDPTRDIVGTLPLIYAEKSAALQVDLGTPNIVDPGDVLRYTITVYNNGAVPATEVVLSDSVPLNTAYVADSTTLNGLPVGQPDGGVSPLTAGVPISSADLTPPLPGIGGGILSAGEAAVLQFDVTVDAAATPGTLIVNQALVSSYEVPDVPTDGDGNPATGPEPTVVVVGDQQQLSITKQVAVVGGGPAIAGATLEYLVRVVNISPVPASYIVITDDLDLPVPAQLLYVDPSATLNGSMNGVTVAGSVITADYGTAYGDLAPDEEIVLRFRATLDSNLPTGTTVTNSAYVTWNDPPQNATATVSIDVGGVPGFGALNGTVWHDANFDNVLDTAERTLGGWIVELYRNGDQIHSIVTRADGTYRIYGLPPNYGTTDQYELRFVAPGAGASTALLGLADSEFTDYLQRIADIEIDAGGNLQDLNLPIDPNGVVYNSVIRTPVPGATLTLIEASSGAPVPASCFDDPNQQNQITLPGGYYKFDLNFSDPGCPSGADYLINVTVPPSGFVAGVSTIIPPTYDSTTGAFAVPTCPGSATDAVAATAQHCEAQTSEFAPSPFVPARTAGTQYYALLTLDGTQAPGSSQIFNNHIPLDPDLADSIGITKTTPLLSVNRGQLVPYTITVTNDIGFDLQDVSIVDRFPPGFRYVEGSARFDRAELEPVVNGRELIWSNLGITGSGRHSLQLLLAVGAGVSEGEYVNRAQAIHSLTGNALSGEGTATVRLVPDPDFDCTDVMGKVFDDANRNGIQEDGESGIPGVRLVTATGLAVTTDGYGRFHITCATVPNETRGSNFVLKLDDRTLPTGFRASTQPVQIQRATRGKALRFSFGASIHRVIGLDIADPIFEPGKTEMRPQWEPRINLLLEELEVAPAVLRLSYLADVEDPQLVDARLEAIEQRIREAWAGMDGGYELTIEPEVFWRLGGPPEQPAETGSRSR